MDKENTTMGTLAQNWSQDAASLESVSKAGTLTYEQLKSSILSVVTRWHQTFLWCRVKFCPWLLNIFVNLGDHCGLTWWVKRLRYWLDLRLTLTQTAILTSSTTIIQSGSKHCGWICLTIPKWLPFVTLTSQVNRKNTLKDSNVRTLLVFNCSLHRKKLYCWYLRRETASRNLWNSCSEYWIRQQLHESRAAIFVAY